MATSMKIEKIIKNIRIKFFENYRHFWIFCKIFYKNKIKNFWKSKFIFGIEIFIKFFLKYFREIFLS